MNKIMRLRVGVSLLLVILFGLMIGLGAARAWAVPPCDGDLGGRGESVEAQNENPLLQPSKLPYGVLELNVYKPEQILPALDVAIGRLHKEWADIRDSSEAPTFENTVAAIEFIGADLERVGRYVHFLAITKKDLVEEIEETFMRKASVAESGLFTDVKMFRRIEALYNQRFQLRLTIEEQRALEKLRQKFISEGVNLAPAARRQMVQISGRLSELGSIFDKNLNQKKKEFRFVLTNAADLVGVPDYIVKVARENAIQEGQTGAWIFKKTDATYSYLMLFADSSEVRKKAFFAWETNTGENDAIVLEIAKLRQQRAQIMGYPDFKSLRTSELMVETPERVQSFIDRLYTAAKPASDREFASLQAFVKQNTGSPNFERWDLAYWQNKMKTELLSFDNEATKEYFPVEKVLKGLFYHLRRTYNISFNQRTDLPTSHEDIRTYEVKDLTSGEVLAVLYLDPFLRPNKSGGAAHWMIQSPYVRNGRRQVAQNIIFLNADPATGERPALMSIRDVSTLFHEMGHFLDGIFAKTSYPSIGRLVWDAIEIPSQANEDFLYVPEVLAQISGHYATGSPIPSEVIEAMKREKTFLAGWSLMNEIGVISLDLAWHSAEAAKATSLDEVEQKARGPYLMMPMAPGVLLSPSLSHIFSLNYASAFHTYAWSNFYAVNVHRRLIANGIYTPAYRRTARQYRERVLALQSTRPARESLLDFLGQEPSMETFLDAILGAP